MFCDFFLRKWGEKLLMPLRVHFSPRYFLREYLLQPCFALFFYPVPINVGFSKKIKAKRKIPKGPRNKIRDYF